MKKYLVSLLALMGSLASPQTILFAAGADSEQALIEVLQSTTAGPAEKDAACARLKFIGTSRCVPALASLLTDEQLSHSARYALEPMPFDEAGAALFDALAKTKALLRVGIINSLATREESRAVPALIELLRDPDAGAASASARALARIGGSDAVKALLTSVRNSTGELHDAAIDGLLRCANRLLASAQRSGALAIFEQLDNSNEKDLVRVAAFRGRVQASGNAGLSLALNAISGHAGPSQMAALQLVRDLQVPNSTKEFCRLLPDIEPAVQISLVGGLAQRGDPSALPGLITLAASSAQPQLRLALIQAFDELGDASVVPLLAGFAASGSADQQRAARMALADLHRGDVTQTLIEQLGASSPDIQAELARALGARGDKAAVPKLLDSAQQGPASARKGVLAALSVLVDDSQLGALVDLVLQAKDTAGRADAAESLNSASQRILTQRGHADATPLIQGFQKGSTEARAALLPICGGFNDPKVRATLRIALHDQDTQVRSAAVRAICDTTDPELLPDLLELARLTKEDSVRSMAIHGGVRLITQEDTVKLSPSSRVAALKTLLECASRPEQKRMVLAGLADVPDVSALSLVDAELSDSPVRNEASRAAVKIASALPGDTRDCETTLKKALAVATDQATRDAVQVALEQLQHNSDYLTNWQVAGPYRQAEKDFSALFEIAFPPETKDSSNAKWQPLLAGADAKRPWVMDLLKALGGQQCVAYARTWVYSDKEHGAVLELGSDDGVKVWLNDKQVYALNVARPLQPGSDKVNITLHAGWNPLLLKITQNNQGWEFCVRVRNADGSHLDGVRCDSAPKSTSAHQ